MKMFVFMDCISEEACHKTVGNIIDITMKMEGAGLDDVKHRARTFPFLMEKDGTEYIACFSKCNDSEMIKFQQAVEAGKGDCTEEEKHFYIFFKEVPAGTPWRDMLKSLYEENGFKKIGPRTKSIAEYEGR